MARRGADAGGFSYEKFKQQNQRVQTAMRRGFVEPERKVMERGPDGNVFRLVGDPHDIITFWAECADGKRRPFFLPDSHELLNLVSEATRGKWVETGKKDKAGKAEKEKKFDYAGTRILAAVQDWRPRRLFLWNCIDRQDGWCKANKHCKILVRSKGDKGFGASVWEGIRDIIDEEGNPEDYDLKVIRRGEKLDTEYAVIKPNPTKTKGVVKGKLSAGERSYGRYDLQELVAQTKDEYITERLGEVIKMADAELGTDFCTTFGIKKGGGRKRK